MYRLIILFSVVLLIGCNDNSSNQKVIKEKGISVENEYAEGFKITRFKDHIQISVINPDTKEVDFEYHIGTGDGNAVVTIPFNPSRVIALSATHIGMMEELNLTDKIVGVSSEDYICSENVLKRIRDKSAASLGDIGLSDIEGYLAAQPDLIITSGFDNKAPILTKMKSAGLTLFTNYDWKETHPLGRAEWIKVFGILFNEEEKATKLFEEICNNYYAIAERVSSQEYKPTVFVGTMYGDIFNAPAGESYMAQLLKDANVNYVYADSRGVGSLTLTLEDVISTNRATDFWLNPAAKNTSQLMQMNTRFELLESVRRENVYSYYENVNCFWEQSAIQPHLILADLCTILHPTLFGAKELMFYSQVKS
jgi:iron complex transport system substrate-binding protein